MWSENDETTKMNLLPPVHGSVTGIQIYLPEIIANPAYESSEMLGIQGLSYFLNKLLCRWQ